MRRELVKELRPIEEPYPAEIETLFAVYPKQKGYLLKLFRVFGNSARFLTKCMPNLLDSESPLSLLERELVILRVCYNKKCEYEWGVHIAIFSEAAGLTHIQIEATCRPYADEEIWNERERCLLLAVDELCEGGTLCQSTLEGFRSFWSVEEQLEVFALCGAYHTVSFVANNAELPLESFAARFPEAC